MKESRWACACLVLLGGCGPERTLVQGLVFTDRPVTGQQVVLTHLEGSSETRTSADGRFSFELDLEEEARVVLASPAFEVPVTVQPGAAPLYVLGAPAVLAAAAEAGGLEAVTLTRYLQVPPHYPAMSNLLDAQVPNELTAEALAGLLHLGLTRLADQYAGDRPGLLAALDEDLRTDGLADGKGEVGRVLRAGGRPLDAFVLRRDLVSAMVEFLRSEENASGLTVEDVHDYLEGRLYSLSPLFPADTWVDRSDAPEIHAEVFRPDGAASETLVRGEVQLVTKLLDPGDLVMSLTVEAIVGRGRIPLSEHEGPLISAQTSISTERFNDGPVVVRVTAEDFHANSTRRDLALEVDNTPPTLEATFVLRDGDMVIETTLDEAAELEVRWNGEVVAREVVDGLPVRLVHSCVGEPTLALRAEDGAGNVGTLTRRLSCGD